MTSALRKISATWFLIIVVSLAYLPFLNVRVLRMAGDEKVYVSQAIEMARDGRWFVQTLSGQPDYYKGPLHYIFVRIGMILFGNNLIAATYMNYLFALAGGLALYFMTRKRWGENSAMLLGTATALNVGVVSHAYASQMEVELCGVYALGMAALGWRALDSKKIKSFKDAYLQDLPFWLCAGVAGWIKSPVHSALLGMGGVLFWLLTGQLWTRLKQPGAWASVFTGIFTCVAGYMPAYLLDKDNFVSAFLGRENVEKPSNGRHIDYVLRSFPHFLFPWSAAALAALVVSIKSLWGTLGKAQTKKLKLDPTNKLMMLLGWSVALPTFVFFCAFPYKGQNYNLPAISALILLGWAAFKGAAPLWSHRIAAGLGVIASGVLAVIIGHFFMGPHAPVQWWSPAWILVSFVMLFSFIAIYFRANNERYLAVGAAFLFAGFASAITPLGTREMRDIKQFMKEHPDLVYHYSNLERTIWSEWGLLQLVTGRQINEIHDAAQLKGALQPGHAILIAGDEAMGLFQEAAKSENVEYKSFNATTWKRWLTKGKDAKGQVRWKSAWQNQDLTILERDFYIIWK